jgi:hypothetical protein
MFTGFGADLKSNMAARVHNVFSLAEILNQLSQNVNSNGIQFMKRNLTGYQFGIY